MSARRLVGLSGGNPGALVVAPRADLGHQRQFLGVGVQRLADELVGDVGAVELCGVDVVDAQSSTARLRTAIAWSWSRGGPNTPGPGRLHGAEPDAIDQCTGPAR